MWDDLFAELVEEGAEGGSARQVRTDAKGVERTVVYGSVPVGSLDDKQTWVDAAEAGIDLTERRQVEGGGKRDRDERGFAGVTGERAKFAVRKLLGVERVEKKKRSGKPDAVSPESNGHASTAPTA